MKTEYDGNSTNYYYDKLGNRDETTNGATTNYSSNNLNQYSAVGGINYDYDLNGNLVDINDGQYEYIYDCENRLIETKEDGSTVATYEYDYLGRRISKTVGSTTTKYCYDGSQVIAEYDGSDNLLRWFFYGPGIDEPIAMYDVSGTSWYWYHYDGLGGVIALSNLSGDIAERYSYDVFGEVTIRNANDQILTTSNYNNPYFFTGRRLDNETGLYYYRARYYSPDIGRFMQTDPIGYAAGLNLYAYVGNNPINWIDPWGLAEVKTAPVAIPGVPGVANYLYGDTNYARYWQIFYDDGSNSGYFGGQFWYFWGLPNFRADKNVSRYDRTIFRNLNDDLLRQAERIVQRRWRRRKNKYNHPNNDCQIYILRVLREYKKLKKE